MKNFLPSVPGAIRTLVRRALPALAIAVVLTVANAAMTSAHAQSSSRARQSAQAANNSNAAAKAAADKAKNDAAAAAAAKQAADEAAAKVAAAAAQAEAERKAAAELAAKQAAEAQALAERKAAAEKAAAEAANAEQARARAAEAAALKLAAERAAKEQADAAAAAARELAENEAKNRAAAAQALKDKAEAEAEAARLAADQAENSRKGAEEAAQHANEHAAAAEAAEQRYYNATNDEDKKNALNDLNSHSDNAANNASQAEEHRNNASEHGNSAEDHSNNAKNAADEMPPLLPGIGAAIQSRSWLLCGGGYPGWAENLGGPADAPGLCAQVMLDVLNTEDPGRMTLELRVRNISGLFNSYAGSVLTGIGLSNIWVTESGNDHDINPSEPAITGSCVPGDQNCSSRWSLAMANHAHMPNGIGFVDLKFDSQGLLGGIASTCSAPPNQGSWSSPSNPNGLFVTPCGDAASFVLFAVTTDAPVDLTHAEVSVRAQNGFLGSSTACIYTGDETSNRNNICQPTTTVPEPGTIALSATGVGAILAARRRKRRALKS